MRTILAALFGEGVRDARSMAPGDKGWLFVSTRTAGNVYAIRHDGKKALETLTIATGLNMPDGALLVSDDLAHAIYRIGYRKP